MVIVCAYELTAGNVIYPISNSKLVYWSFFKKANVSFAWLCGVWGWSHHGDVDVRSMWLSRLIWCPSVWLAGSWGLFTGLVIWAVPEWQLGLCQWDVLLWKANDFPLAVFCNQSMAWRPEGHGFFLIFISKGMKQLLVIKELSLVCPLGLSMAPVCPMAVCSQKAWHLKGLEGSWHSCLLCSYRISKFGMEREDCLPFSCGLHPFPLSGLPLLLRFSSLGSG